ncbi:hypothetical protein LTR91_009714 [Friedmanniomyces endolithicus]|uniref:DUF7907 domain-containing protein n=1 Tax=Friedmanniomyces endolithicus TaxID=329885 RepID=A0AAN6QTM8_9PEZI|nr:hypothetical protein LTR82_016664 [Friedmanniomyces endolithicus]KAK0987930.1 hypothetical protein LTR91_009714 [Friedmanniomyces endolithicus]
MQLLAALFALSALVAAALSQSVNTSQEYNLKTCLKPDQPGKQRFDNLYLYTYHTGAGENDVVFDAALTNSSAKGFLTPVTNSTAPNNNFQQFDLGTQPYPWTMIMAEAVNFYAAWEPVRINVGGGSTSSAYGIETGFFMNSTGLQWTSSPGNAGAAQDEFGGWLGMCFKTLAGRTFDMLTSEISLQLVARGASALLPQCLLQYAEVVYAV